MNQHVYLVLQDYDDGETFSTTTMGAFTSEGLAQTYRAKLALHGADQETSYRIEAMELDANIDHEQVYTAHYSIPLTGGPTWPRIDEDWFVGPDAVDRELVPDTVSVTPDQTRVYISCSRWSEDEAREAAETARTRFLQEWQQNHD